MKYVVFINLGPGARGWQALPEARQAEVQAAWGELNQTPGLTPEPACSRPRPRRPCGWSTATR